MKHQSRPKMLVPVIKRIQHLHCKLVFFVTDTYFTKGSEYSNNDLVIHLDTILMLRMCYDTLRKDFFLRSSFYVNKKLTLSTKHLDSFP